MGSNIILVLLAMMFLITSLYILLFLKSFKKPKAGTALIRTGAGGSKVVIEGALLAIPILHQVEEIDLTTKTFTVRQAVLTKDQLSATIEVVFYFRIGNNSSSVRAAAQSIGCERSFQQEALEKFFLPKLSNALKIVGSEFDSTTLTPQNVAVKMSILQTVGTDLDGYELDDCVVERVDLVPAY